MTKYYQTSLGSPGLKPQLKTDRECKTRVYCPAIGRKLNEINKCFRLVWLKIQPDHSSPFVKTRAIICITVSKQQLPGHTAGRKVPHCWGLFRCV